MKYSSALFMKNIEYLVNYGYEPEIHIFLKNDKKIFLIVYEDFIDFYDENNCYQKLSNIKVAIDKIDFTKVLAINDNTGIDLSRPIEEQSILIDGILYMTV